MKTLVSESHPLLIEAVVRFVTRQDRKRIGEEKLLPIALCTLKLLLRTAQQPGKTVSYEDISRHCGLGTPRWANISFGAIAFLRSLLKEDGRFPQLPIPDISTIVTHKGKPTSGRGALTDVPDIEKRSDREKQAMLFETRESVWNWPHWEELASFLNISVLPVLQPSYEELLRFDELSDRRSGKSPEHQAMQERILYDPYCVGIGIHGEIDRGSSKCEYLFWSLDRVDVMVKTSEEWIAFEVKPSSASVSELRKGIYQAFKYAALVGADLLDRGRVLRARCVLVLSGRLTEELSQLAKRLHVEVIEGF